MCVIAKAEAVYRTNGSGGFVSVPNAKRCPDCGDVHSCSGIRPAGPWVNPLPFPSPDTNPWPATGDPSRIGDPVPLPVVIISCGDPPGTVGIGSANCGGMHATCQNDENEV